MNTFKGYKIEVLFIRGCCYFVFMFTILIKVAGKANAPDKKCIQ